MYIGHVVDRSHYERGWGCIEKLNWDMPCMRHEKACSTTPRSGDRQKTCFFWL